MERYYIKTTKFSIRERVVSDGKVYDVRFRITDLTGKTSQKVLSGYRTKSEAKRAYAEFVKKYCDILPDDFAVEKKKKKKMITISEAFSKYIATKASELKESSVVSIQNAFRKHILPDYGSKNIKEFKKQDAVLFIDKMCTKTQPNGKLYSRKYIGTVRTFFSSMYEWLAVRYEIHNPFAHVYVPKGTKQAVKKQLQFWDRDEFEQFISAVDNPLYHALFSLLFFSGMRKSEAFALKLDDYNGDTLHVCKAVTRKTIDGYSYKVTANKNAKDYCVPVCESLKAELDSYIVTIDPQSEFLFGGNSPLAPTTVQRVFDHYIALSKVKEINIHGLRHSFVSLCIHHGANYMVADLICDSPEQVLRTYGHMWDSDKRTIINSIK